MRGFDASDVGSPLSQGRELKSPAVYSQLAAQAVAPLAGAGIEIISGRILTARTASVAPLAGAGIEIWIISAAPMYNASPLSQGRELK